MCISFHVWHLFGYDAVNFFNPFLDNRSKMTNQQAIRSYFKSIFQFGAGRLLKTAQNHNLVKKNFAFAPLN